MYAEKSLVLSIENKQLRAGVKEEFNPLGCKHLSVEVSAKGEKVESARGEPQITTSEMPTVSRARLSFSRDTQNKKTRIGTMSWYGPYRDRNV